MASYSKRDLDLAATFCGAMACIHGQGGCGAGVTATSDDVLDALGASVQHEHLADLAWRVVEATHFTCPDGTEAHEIYAFAWADAEALLRDGWTP